MFLPFNFEFFFILSNCLLRMSTLDSCKSPGFLNMQEDSDAINTEAEVHNNPPGGLNNNIEQLNINTTGATGNAEFFVAATSSSLSLPSFWLERPHT